MQEVYWLEQVACGMTGMQWAGLFIGESVARAFLTAAAETVPALRPLLESDIVGE
jgi:hypothetical protein